MVYHYQPPTPLLILLWMKALLFSNEHNNYDNDGKCYYYCYSDTNTTGTASEEQGEGEQQQCQLELMTNEETFGLGDSVTLTVTNGGDEDLVFSNSILGLEIENQDTGEAYPLFSAQAIITLRPGESRTSELSYECTS